MHHLRLFALVLVFAGSISAQVDLGSAGSFAVLGGTTVKNTGQSSIDGQVGVAPGASITGFPPGKITNGGLRKADSTASQAQEDVTTAYHAASELAPDTNLTGQDLGGQTLVPGVYLIDGSTQLSDNLILDGQGDSNGVWVFQIGSTLTTGDGASVTLKNGGKSSKVFWQVGNSATIGSDTTFVGSILALTSITVDAGASANGGLYAHSGAITLHTNKVNAAV